MGQKGEWLEEMGQKEPQNEMWGGKNGWKNSVVGKKWVKRSPKWVKRNTHMKCRVGKMGQKVV